MWKEGKKNRSGKKKFCNLTICILNNGKIAEIENYVLHKMEKISLFCCGSLIIIWTWIIA